MTDTQERIVMVGSEPVKVNETEWLAANMKPGTLVYFTRKPAFGTNSVPRSGFATFKHTWWYDGVIAELEGMGGERIGVHLSIGDTIRLATDAEIGELNSRECGAGI